MTTIKARVNDRLLAKASRLFTGTLTGRITEILQNARRAGAWHVVITNNHGLVTVRDDGRGIDDFATLLDLGGSGWEQSLEASEDPAGVGLFCLAPHTITIRSGGRKVTIDQAGWTGASVAVQADRRILSKSSPHIAAGVGTELVFDDEPWQADLVRHCAVFSGLEVSVDGEVCPSLLFLIGSGQPHPQLGCRIQVVDQSALTPWHRSAAFGHDYGKNVLLNFHGQVVAFAYRPTSKHELHFLVEMTGGTTGIRLMLPARTCLVENDAFITLRAVLEREAYVYLLRQGRHRLPYREYLRGRELGIDLPESQPVYRVGLLHRGQIPEPVEVFMPPGHQLPQCYRLTDTKEGDDTDAANTHLLAALGTFDSPLVPVDIDGAYDGYGWGRLPTVGLVTVSAGKVLQESLVNGRELICVESLSIRIFCSDGRIFESGVCMAMKPPDSDEVETWLETPVYVTPAAASRLTTEELWSQLGGFSDDGDTYDTQECQVQRELDEFWQRLVGPHETLRNRLLEAASDLPQGWKELTLRCDGQVTLLRSQGSVEVLALPPVEGSVSS